MGAIEIKGRWQLGLGASDSLLQVLQSAKKGKMAMEVIQQVSELAVLETSMRQATYMCLLEAQVSDGSQNSFPLSCEDGELTFYSTLG